MKVIAGLVESNDRVYGSAAGPYPHQVVIYAESQKRQECGYLKTLMKHINS